MRKEPQLQKNVDGLSRGGEVPFASALNDMRQSTSALRIGIKLCGTIL